MNRNSSVNTSTGDFILAAHHFGVAHPPGYPLYVSLGYIWMRLFPFGSPAYKLNFFTSIIGGVAAFILYITTYRYAVHANCCEKTDAKYMTLILISVFAQNFFCFRLTGFAPSAVLASSAFAFSHLTWFHSIGAEIFALNNLFCGLLLYWVIKFQQTSVKSRAWVCAEIMNCSNIICNYI